MTTKPRVFVVDTCYIDELFRVDGWCKDQAHQPVKNKFSDAITNGYRLYVPLPVLFEVANHIASVSNTERRRELVNKFLVTVTSSVKKSNPWIITPPGDPTSIQELMAALEQNINRYASDFSMQTIGLTDTIVIMEAERLKKKYRAMMSVHIWTTDKRVKTREPDKEPNPFV